MKGILLIGTSRGGAFSVRDRIRGFEGVTSAEAYTGPYGVIAHVEVANQKAFEMLFGRVTQLHGVANVSACAQYGK